MNKIIIYIVVVVVVLVSGFFALTKLILNEKQAGGVPTGSPEFARSYVDSGYSYFGNVAEGDLDGDGMDDAAFILFKDGGGSGTFYYVGAAFKSARGYAGTNAILLGDRIAPQTTEIRNGVLIVNYADRKEGESMTARPSVGVSKYLRTWNGTLVPVTN